MEQDKKSSQPLPSTDDSAKAMRHSHMTGHSQEIDAGAALAATRFPLLRRISITSLLATLITATLLIFLYRQDQLDEHQEIAAQENEKTAVHLIHLMNDQINAYVAATAGLDTQALRAYPGIAPFNATLDTVREHAIVKLKLYNPSGIPLFSSVPDDIGGAAGIRTCHRKPWQAERSTGWNSAIRSAPRPAMFAIAKFSPPMCR